VIFQNLPFVFFQSARGGMVSFAKILASREINSLHTLLNPVARRNVIRREWLDSFWPKREP
jgi:hypothetical protein